MINGGMKRGTPESAHRFVVPFYGDTRAYAESLDMDTKAGHVFLYLLDRDGTIHWHGEGEAHDSTLAGLFDATRALE